MTRVFYNFQIVGALYQTPGGREAEAGDEITIFLDQTRNADFPASIPGLLQNPIKRVSVVSGSCLVEGTSYSFSYDSDDLEDASAVILAACDITAISVTSCCEALRADLLEETAARTAADAALQDNIDEVQDDLDTWDVLTLTAEPVQGVAGLAQVDTQTVVGTIATAGTVTLTVTAAGMTGSPLTLTFDADAGDVASVTAAKAAAKLAATAAVVALFDVDNIGPDFALTANANRANDGTLNIAITNGTATGLTPDATSTNTVAGIAAVTGTAASRIGQHAQWGDRIWEAIDTAPATWVEITTERNSVMHNPSVAGLNGGGGSKLDGLTVTEDDIGRVQLVPAATTNGYYVHVLYAGTDAENSPYVIRPDNYAGGTNEVVWYWKPAFTNSESIVDASTGGNGAADDGKAVLYTTDGNLLVTGVLGLVDSVTTAFALFTAASALTVNRTLSPPDADGTLALFPVIVAATPLTGFTITAARYTDQTHYLTPAGVLATGAFTLPTAANSRVGQIVRLWSTQVVTALTVTVSGAGTILGTAITASAIVANTPYAWQCVSTAGTGTWIRIS